MVPSRRPEPLPAPLPASAASPARTTLPLTGERTVPGVPEETYWFARHVAAYGFAAGVARRRAARHLVDAGCGEGYGLALLAGTAAQEPDRDARDGDARGRARRDADHRGERGRPSATRVTGIERDPSVAAHVRRAYGDDPRISVVEAELGAVPLADGSQDLVVLLQVIEHLHDVDAALGELVRLIRDDGTLIVSTPNRRTFSPGDAAPVNPFHVREFAPDELAGTLAAAGLVLEHQFGLHHGPRLAEVERARGRTLHDALTSAPPSAWPDWLADLVPTVTPDDFVLREGTPGVPALEDALDLVVDARVRPRGAA